MSTPNILLLADYPQGVVIAEYLKSRGEQIVGCGIHPPSFEGLLNAGCTKKILQILKLPKERIFKAEDIQSGAVHTTIKALKPDIILCVLWNYLLKPETIALAKECINLHLSYLPYNRGRNPNVWPILEGTPAGVTLHHIDKGVDTGDIIAQQEVPVLGVDTAKTLHEKLVATSIALFQETWPAIAWGEAPRTKQNKNKGGTHHTRKDFEKLETIDLAKTYTGKELINLLRAKTFPPFPGAYFIDKDGRKVQIRVELSYQENEKEE